MAFAVPFSSSPPGTPEKTPEPKVKFSFGGLDNHPSTTPAGPPPSSAHSFTPADPPPSSIYGSSQLGTGVSKLRFNQPASDRSLFGSSTAASSMKPPRTKNGNTPGRPFGGSTFKMPESSPYSSPAAPAFDQSRYTTVSEEDDHEDDDIPDIGKAGTPDFGGFTSVNPGNTSHFQGGASKFGRSMQSSASRSRFGASKQKTERTRKPSALPGSGKGSVIPDIARDMAARSKVASLFEPDDMILATEDVVSQCTEAVHQRGLLPEVTHDILSRASAECLKLWTNNSEEYRHGGLDKGDGLGPGEDADPISKATFITSLLLELHHPPLQQSRQNQGAWHPNNRSLAIIPFSAPKAAAVPQILLEWLDKYHTSTELALRMVESTEPNCTAHEMFWETILGLLIRGKFREIIQLFDEADFRHADSALDDGESEPGYRGAQLQSVQAVVARARQILEASPAARAGDWHVDNSDWSIFRKRVESELDYLADMAEGGDHGDAGASFEAEHFGMSASHSRSLSQSTRRAHSNIPWTIYEKLKIFYNILLGSSVEIIAQSQDWLEATLALTIWWDGTQDDSIASWSLSVSRQSARPTKAPLTEGPYLSRLSAAFLAVTDPEVEDSFQIDTLSSVEVGLASVLQGNLEGVLGSLRSWSLTVASALAEIGSMGGWIQSTPQSKKPSGFDEEDLMVLSYGQDRKSLTKDDILHTYAEELFGREEMANRGEIKEGWELAIAIATRLDDQDLAKETISQLLEDLHLTSQERMDKLVMLCTDLGLEEQARSVSERFADHLMSTTTLYGPALIAFARAHSTHKLRTLVSLLVSYTLVSSVAYPLEAELDPALDALLHNPKTAFTSIADIDAEAASMLQYHLTGYASLRKFYALRDADHLPPMKGVPQLRPLARTRLAAKYLIAAINSAADPIYGGLYDAQRESAIQVDGLLTLLGEASALLSQHQAGGKRIFTEPQIYDLLRAIEDLETVNERVYTACQECFNATLQNFFDGDKKASPPSPRDMLKKSISGSGTGSNFSFSMMGSEMLNSNTGSNSGSKVLKGDVKRGWDWRRNFLSPESGAGEQEEVKGRDVLMRLRLGLGSELSMLILRD